MTDSKLLTGIMQNDDRAWRYICLNMKQGFATILGKSFSFGPSAKEDIEDIFQESLMILMRNVKKGRVTVSHDGALFSYLVQIGKLTACNVIRQKHPIGMEDVNTISMNLDKEIDDFEMTVTEKQQMQNEFLDRAYDSLPDTCKIIFKKYYWERKTWNDIADIIGYSSEDSVKTKKSRCMKKFVDFAKKLIADDEYAEEAIRDAVDRAALKELIEEERIYARTGVTRAALDIDEDSDMDD